MNSLRTLALDSTRLQLRRLDGRGELAVAEALAMGSNRPRAVSQVLSIMLLKDDGSELSLAEARAFPSATREWLLQCIGQWLRPNLRWFEASCTHCDAAFDLDVDLHSQSFRPAPSTAAEVEVCTSLGPRRFAIPRGSHEEDLATGMLRGNAQRQVVALCGLSATAQDDADQFNGHDLQLIDEALEAASPDVADGVETDCPVCGQTTFARIDPLRFAFPNESQLLADIHFIASAYGWAHEPVLQLSARHRTALAGAISRDRQASHARAR